MIQLSVDAFVDKKPLTELHLPPLEKTFIHKQEVTCLLLPVCPELVPLLASKKSHYYSFKMNIKFRNIMTNPQKNSLSNNEVVYICKKKNKKKIGICARHVY